MRCEVRREIISRQEGVQQEGVEKQGVLWANMNII